MKNLLVKGNVDYADEFDCKVFGVFTDKTWEKLKQKMKKSFKNEGWELYFGTNEALIFDSYLDWLGRFEIIEISETEAEFLTKYFGQTWGTGSRALEAREEE